MPITKRQLLAGAAVSAATISFARTALGGWEPDQRDGPDEPFEVHVLKFPSRDLYDAYRDDAERRSLSGERAGIITNTDSLVGTPRPTYGP